MPYNKPLLKQLAKKETRCSAIINRNNQLYEMPADELPDNLKTVSGNE